MTTIPIKRGEAGSSGMGLIVPVGFREKVLPSSASGMAEAGNGQEDDQGMWTSRQALVDTVQYIQSGLNEWIRSEINLGSTAEETMNGIDMPNGPTPQPSQPSLLDMQERGMKDTLRQQAVKKLLEAGGIELSVSDYWAGRLTKPTLSCSNSIMTRQKDDSPSETRRVETFPAVGDVKMNARRSSSSSNLKDEGKGQPEFGLRFRLPGVVRGFIVFGPRRRRRARMRGLRGVVGAGSDVGGGRGSLEEGGPGHDHGDMVVNGHQKEDEKEGDDVEDEGMMMLAIRFNVFSDTELVSP